VLSERFPHSGRFAIGGHELSASEVVEIMGEYLTSERQERIQLAVEGRTCDLVPVLEDIYDRGNISAVLRSAEAMGCQVAHVIEIGEKFKSANRVSKGADKWLDVKRWKSSPSTMTDTLGERPESATLSCVRELKRLGYQILATHLDDRAKPIGEMDFSRPTAIVFGNEKDGISPEMAELADHTIIIPMQGFVQSFNISVAAAIALYHAHSERVRKLGRAGNLSPQEKEILRAEFSLRSSDNPERLIEEVLTRRPL
jgi:tRNA (guanosine-2'-O-)-methyltransferase